MQQVLTEGERVRRQELTRDTKAALSLGLSLDQYIAQRDQVTDEWCAWLRAEMDRLHAESADEIMPQALTRLQERVVAEARRVAEKAAGDMVKTMLRRAITS